MKRLLIATMLLAATALPASARMRPFHTSGYWTANSGTLENGVAACSMSASYYATNTGEWTRGVYFKWAAGDNFLTVHLFKKAWSIPPGTKLQLNIGVDRQWAWSVQSALGQYVDRTVGSVVEFTISADRFAEFIGEFREANTLWFRFPNGNEPTWGFSMRGSRDVANAFAYCMKRTAGSAPTQPYGSAPTQPNTQPFDTPPNGSPGPAPVQPFTGVNGERGV
jgi:hypothetical protein